ncbi:ArnT family glycosyltransferase [Derxia lacustris]|uniref:ArnT family glycosyltransferase n=1 Tax=Derxia lacustris TaxID=764842 RepID=UPI000A16D43B|nr:glycosyltransferase family 39 protein [Derxia lacustris]
MSAIFSTAERGLGASLPRRMPVFIGLLVFALAGFWIGSSQQPLFDLDEGAFSEATLEMLRSGNFLVTTLDGAPRYDKPILSYWLQGLSVSLFGVHEFAFRLPSMIAATLWMWITFGFVRERESYPEAPWLAAASLALGLIPALIGHAATADAILNLLLAAAGLDLWRHFESGRRAPLLRAALWIGLGVLAKGPIAVIVPGLAGLVWALWERRPFVWLRAGFDWAAWLVVLAVVLPWGVACWLADDGDFIRHFLFDHNVNRYSRTMEGHGGHLWYYVVTLPLIVAPFTSLLPGAFRRALAGDALDRYCLSWFAVVLALFSFSSTQLPHYLLYGCTPLFVLFGRQALRLPGKLALLLPGWIVLAVIASVPLWLPTVAANTHHTWDAAVLAGALDAVGPGYVAVSLAALVLGFAAWAFAPLSGLVVVGIAMQLAVWFALVPAIANGQQQPTRQAGLHARAAGATVVSYATKLPTFSVYRGAATPARLPAPGEWAFLRIDRLADLQRDLGPQARLAEEFRQGGVLLMRREADAPAALPAAPADANAAPAPTAAPALAAPAAAPARAAE